MLNACQQILKDLEPELQSRMVKNLERRLGVINLEELTTHEADFIQKELEAYLWIERSCTPAFRDQQLDSDD